MEFESKMTKDQTKDLARAIVQNDDIPINSERTARDIAKTIANRVDDNIKRKQATDIYNKAQEVGYELSDEDTKHLTDAFPDEIMPMVDGVLAQSGNSITDHQRQTMLGTYF